MPTAKLFEHGDLQAVDLPEPFRFTASEVEIEKRGEEVILRPKGQKRVKTLDELAEYMRLNFPEGAVFPEIERPAAPHAAAVDLD